MLIQVTFSPKAQGSHCPCLHCTHERLYYLPNDPQLENYEAGLGAKGVFGASPAPPRSGLEAPAWSTLEALDTGRG